MDINSLSDFSKSSLAERFIRSVGLFSIPLLPKYHCSEAKLLGFTDGENTRSSEATNIVGDDIMSL